MDQKSVERAIPLDGVEGPEGSYVERFPSTTNLNGRQQRKAGQGLDVVDILPQKQGVVLWLGVLQCAETYDERFFGRKLKTDLKVVWCVPSGRSKRQKHAQKDREGCERRGNQGCS